MPSTLDSIKAEIRQALNVWQALRKLGFDADDIYVSLGCPDPGHASDVVVLVRRNGKAAHFHVAKWNGTKEEFAAAYLEASRLMNAASQDELEALWEERAPGLSTQVATSVVMARMWQNGRPT